MRDKKNQKEKEHVEEESQEEKEVVKGNVLKRPCGCCNVKLAPLQAGQRYFEAPDGHIILGEDTVQQIYDRRGKGHWINPLR